MHLNQDQVKPQSDRSQSLGIPGIDVLATLPDESFERYTSLVREALRVDAALVSLFDSGRHFLKGRIRSVSGEKEESGLGRDELIGRWVVEKGQPMAVSDALHNDRIRDLLAVEHIGLVSYSGAPIHANDGSLLGVISAIHSQPRTDGEADRSFLKVVAGLLSTEAEWHWKTTALNEVMHLLEEATIDWEKKSRRLLHDMRTPVCTMVAVAELLEMTLTHPTLEQIEYLRMTRQSADKLTGMLEELFPAPKDTDSGRRALAQFKLVSAKSRIQPP